MLYMKEDLKLKLLGDRMIKEKIEEWISKKVEERFDELWELHSKEIKKELDNLRLRILILNRQVDKILADLKNIKKV